MKYRRLYALVLCFIHIGIFCAQEIPVNVHSNLSKKKSFWEGGMNIYRLDLAGNGHYYAINRRLAKILDHNFFRGINFKYFFGKNALRSTFDYYQTGQKPFEMLNDVRNVRSKTGVLTIGYQRLLLKGRFSPYVFTDISCSYTEKKGYISCLGCFSYYRETPYFYKTTAFGISPGLGLRYNPFSSVVISAETYLQYSRVSQKDVKNTSHSYKTMDLKAHPLQVTLGFIF